MEKDRNIVFCNFLWYIKLKGIVPIAVGVSFCVNCVNALKGEKQNLTNNSSNVTLQSVLGSGTVIANMVLGIIAGIVLNLITIFLCVAEYIIIAG